MAKLSFRKQPEPLEHWTALLITQMVFTFNLQFNLNIVSSIKQYEGNLF